MNTKRLSTYQYLTMQNSLQCHGKNLSEIKNLASHTYNTIFLNFVRISNNHP